MMAFRVGVPSTEVWGGCRECKARDAPCRLGGRLSPAQAALLSRDQGWWHHLHPYP